MKTLIILLFLISGFIYCQAQDHVKFAAETFESQVLSYVPRQKVNVSKKDFDYGKMILQETKKATEDNPANFNLADYFNVLSAFLTLKESEGNIMLAFSKFSKAEGSCEYFLELAKVVEKNPKYDIIRTAYQQRLNACKAVSVKDEPLDLNAYSKANNLHLSLVEMIHQVDINDQKYRRQNTKEARNKQKELDEQNQKIIDALFEEYNTYIGRKMVGEKYENVMWAVIQHANLGMMEKYLPVVQKAVEEKQLDVVPFKMLIDRYYGLKHGYQIFGSQSGFGFEMADERTRKEIIKKYGL
ncbi:MAG: hypothetical protein AAF502_07365 [Bacteroidota bacterium]